jgi:Holliday junction resolvase RusA-like endonuclease
MRYRVFADEVRALGMKIKNGNTVFFGIPMPKSWSRKKKFRYAGTPHQQKPDIDNLLKALLDALYSDDSHIWTIRIEKTWATTGFIEIEEA